MPQSFLAFHFKQDTRSAVLLVIISTIIVWFMFNLVVETYPTRSTQSYSTNVGVSSEIGYPARFQ